MPTGHYQRFRTHKTYHWTISEELTLIANHPNMTLKQLHKFVFPNHTQYAIQQKIHAMQIAGKLPYKYAVPERKHHNASS